VIEAPGCRSRHIARLETQSRMCLDPPEWLSLEYTRLMMGFLLFMNQPGQVAGIEALPQELKSGVRAQLFPAINRMRLALKELRCQAFGDHIAFMYDVTHVIITLPCRGCMEFKTARLTLLMDPNKKAALERLCAQQDLTVSQVVRQLIRDYLAQHGVQYTPGRSPVNDSAPVDHVAPAQATPAVTRGKPPPAKRRVARRPGS